MAVLSEGRGGPRLPAKDIGNDIAEIRKHVDKARESNIAIRNEEALRHEVPAHVWERGVPIRDWVEQRSRHGRSESSMQPGDRQEKGYPEPNSHQFRSG